METRSALIALVVTTWLPLTALADVRLPLIFTDNMVVQRNQPIRVWGWAEPEEMVTVTLSGKQAAAKADAKGGWAVELPAMKEGENLELIVAGKNAITLTNVIVGDIWVCSGQSNMEMPLEKQSDGYYGCLNAEDDIKTADYPKIRRIKIRHTTAMAPGHDTQTIFPWVVCTPKTAGKFTGVGFYFAREVHHKTGVPIGLIDDTWAASSIEPWTPPAAMQALPELQKEAMAWATSLADYHAKAKHAIDETERWLSVARAALDGGAQIPATPVVPGHPGIHGPSGWGGMYHGMIHPLVRLPIKGVLWYQGESSGPDAYDHKMRALVSGWRTAWNQSPPAGAGATVGEFPFYFVQLSAIGPPEQHLEGRPGKLVLMREAQFKALAIANSGMAVTIDTEPRNQAIPIHPSNKYDVGVRLSRWALNRDYGMKDVVPSGPLFKSMTVEGDKIRLAFDFVGSGLMVGAKDGRASVVEDKAGKLQRFAIYGSDNNAWVWADAVIAPSAGSGQVGDTVLVSSPKVRAPVAVRYALNGNPGGANLYNRDGLPASPFRTDNWR